jgi:chromosome segregation ATPase
MKVQKSTEIENELDQTTKRLDELTEMRSSTKANVETLQQGFVSGKTSLDGLQTEQGKLTILNESIKALEAKKGELHAAFQKASLSESRADILREMEKTISTGKTAFDEYLSIREELSGIIGEYADKLIAKSTVFHNSREEYQSLARRIEPELSDFHTLSHHSIRREELEKSVGEEVKSLGVRGEDLRLLSAESLTPPGVRFGQSIEAAVNFAAQEKQREMMSAAS